MKKYLHPFVFGFCAGLAVIFVPYFIDPLGRFMEKSSESILNAFPILIQSPALSTFPVFFLFTLPFFAILTITPRFKNKLKTAANKLGFLFGSFLIFSLGFMVSFGIWILVAGAAFSGIGAF